MNTLVDSLHQCMCAHVERHVGPIQHVFCAPGPELPHIDLLHVPPTPRRRRHTLFTCGMSQLPMQPPKAAAECRFAELYLSLPPDWNIGPGLHTEAEFWPLRELGSLAHLPHRTESWVWTGHTVGNPDPNERITPDLGFTAWLLGPHLSLGHDGCVFSYGKREVMIHSVIPIYKEELELALTKGSESLFDLLEMTCVSDLVDVRRFNVCRCAPQR